MSLTLKLIADALDLPCPKDMPIRQASIDTRTIEKGDMFVAFPGEQVNGYDYIPDAVQKGASAVLTIKAHPDVSVPQLVYPDLEAALAKMAVAYRAIIKCKVVALTGSNGKTSVKEMLGCILSQVGTTFVTPGNKNNHIGVPLSMLMVKDDTEYAVFELGANHQGEIAYTVGLVQPEIALINNIGLAHIEGFGSEEGIAKGKGEIYQGLTENGIAIVNEDDAYAHYWDESIKNKACIRFAIENHHADVWAENIHGSAFTLSYAGVAEEVCLQVPGRHHIYNTLAAASMAIALGVNLKAIAKGLSEFQGVSGRLTQKKGQGGAIILDDTYNANLNSVVAGMEVLAGYAGKRILVLGDLGELGDKAHEHHKAIGDRARSLGLDAVFTCGDLSKAATDAFGGNAQHFTDKATLITSLKPILDEETTVLVKGSRSSRMEKVVAELCLGRGW